MLFAGFAVFLATSYFSVDLLEPVGAFLFGFHVVATLVPPSTHCPEIPQDLERIILCCLAKSPADRFQTAEALRKALANCEVAGHWNRALAVQWWQRKEPETAVV